jgi:hypothetical protein
MKKFRVTVTGTFTRTGVVEAESGDSAIEAFSLLNESEIDEDMETDEIEVEEAT